MAPVPTPLRWTRRTFAVLESRGLVDRRTALAVSGVVAGPFAIYPGLHGRGFTLIHLPSQGKILDLEMQVSCKDAAERFAALDLNWWSCIPEEVIGPDLQAMKNLHARLKPDSFTIREVEEQWKGPD